MSKNGLDELFDIRKMSEEDLISDNLLWTLLHKMQSKQVLESEFIKNHDVEAVERNDQLLLIINRLYGTDGYTLFWSGSGLDKTFFIVGKNSNTAYTKRYKARFPSDTS